jgi:hypothetical protein
VFCQNLRSYTFPLGVASPLVARSSKKNPKTVPPPAFVSGMDEPVLSGTSIIFVRVEPCLA